MPHRKLYSQRLSQTSVPINSDGSRVNPKELGEQVTIGFGTGEITGELLGPSKALQRPLKGLQKAFKGRS